MQLKLIQLHQFQFHCLYYDCNMNHPNFKDCKYLRMLKTIFLVSGILLRIPVYTITNDTFTLSNVTNSQWFRNILQLSNILMIDSFQSNDRIPVFHCNKSQYTSEGFFNYQIEAVISSASGQRATFWLEMFFQCQIENYFGRQLLLNWGL